MTDSSFPLPAIGLVHIFNRITQRRPIRATETLSLRVRATPIEPHPRGKQFSIRSEALVGDELVWEEISTNLRRGSGGDGRAPEVPSAEDLPATATWRLPGDLGRRYAGVSGDMNPIHMHPLSARLFGFPTAIAHGMWTKARCLAALESRLPESFTVEAAFRWVLSNPDVDGLIISMTSPDRIDEYLGASGWRSAARDDLPLLWQYAQMHGTAYCRHGCNDCEGACPYGVPIADVLRTRMYAQDYGDMRLARS